MSWLKLYIQMASMSDNSDLLEPQFSQDVYVQITQVGTLIAARVQTLSQVFWDPNLALVNVHKRLRATSWGQIWLITHVVFCFFPRLSAFGLVHPQHKRTGLPVSGFGRLSVVPLPSL